jgi:antitoxin MazE
MRLQLSRIGNSRGIRIPKPLIAQCGLGDVVELRVSAEGLVIAPHRAPRHGWRRAFAASQLAGDEVLLGSVTNAFDGKDWKW